MPMYEFRCSECNHKFSQLVGMTADSRSPSCPKCGSGDAVRLISRFCRIRSEDDVLDAFEDSAMGADMDDPKSATRWISEMGKEMGEEFGEDFDEYMEEAEREMFDGEGSADEVEKTESDIATY